MPTENAYTSGHLVFSLFIFRISIFDHPLLLLFHFPKFSNIVIAVYIRNNICFTFEFPARKLLLCNYPPCLSHVLIAISAQCCFEINCLRLREILTSMYRNNYQHIKKISFCFFYSIYGSPILIAIIYGCFRH